MANWNHSPENEQETDPKVLPILTNEQFYRALASKHRRRLLYFLTEEQTSTVEELATVLTGWKATETGKLGTVEDRENARIRLVHVHLPLLEESELVQYDRQRKTVTLASLDPLITELLSRSVEAEHTSSSDTTASERTSSHDA